MQSTQASTYDLVEKLETWIQTPGYSESWNYLRTHSELLSDEAEAILAELAQIQKNDETHTIIKHHLAVLHRCREIGIGRAFSEKPKLPYAPDSIYDLPFKLEAFLEKCETLTDAQQFLEKHPELLCDETEVILASWVETEESDEVRHFLIEVRNLLHYCRETSIRQAFTELLSATAFEISPELASLLSKLDQPPETPSNLPQYCELCIQALTLVDKNTNPKLWALLQNNLGVCYSQNPQGNRKDNLEAAIFHYQQALEFRTKYTSSEDWAQTHLNLGNAFSNRITGRRGDNLEKAIFHYEQALEIYSRQAFPQNWGVIQINLGNAYIFRIAGEQRENVEQAIFHSQQALEVCTRENYPEGWAMAHHNLGTAFFGRRIGSRLENLEQAIFHFNQALKVRTYHNLPTEWAMTHNNLGEVYRERIVGNRAENIEQAINHYHQALKVFTQQNFPDNWAMTHHNLVNAFLFRITGSRVDNLEQALSYCQQALKVYARQDYPEYWANIQQDLANVYSQRIAGQRAANLEKAIFHYKQALEIKTERDFPASWALIQHNLANAYEGRISGNRAENLEQALFHCNQALKVYTRQGFPKDWAMVQGTMATIFLSRIIGEQRNNLEQAIFHNNQALEVYTYNDYPLNWAGVQLNLGVVYRNRIEGDKATNLEQAIGHLKDALKVYTRQDFPEDWAMVQNNLASAFLFRIVGDRSDNLEKAIFHSNRAFEVYTREAYPERWAKTQQNLASVFLFRIAGQRNENIEQAVIHCQQALSVFSRSAFPVEHASAHHNLAIAYFERLEEDRADNLEQSIFHSNQALEVYSPQNFPHDWAMVLNNLASAYYNRITGEREDNLEKAILHYKQALTVHTRRSFPEHWAQIQNNLGEVYRNRRKGKREENFEQALYHLNQALEVYTQQAFPERWAAIQANLGGVLLNMTNGERVSNIERGIFSLQQATQVYTRKAFPEKWAIVQVSLGEAYHNHVAGERTTNLQRAINHYQQALEIFQPDLFPNYCRRVARNLGHLHFDEQNWVEAHKAYHQAIQAGELLLLGSYTEVGRQAEVRETSRLYARISYCLLKMGKPSQSLQLLEQGKTRLLTEAMALGDVDLTGLTSEQQRSLSELRQKVGALEAEMRLPLDSPARRDNAELGRLLRRDRQNLNQLINIIRKEQPDFMPTGLELPDLLALIPKGGALIAPLVTSQGGAVFILPNGVETVTEDQIIFLNEFTESTLHTLLIGFGDNMGWLSAYNRRKDEGFQAWLKVIEAVTEKLWQVLMGPIHKRLQELGLICGAPVTIMPQGGLGVFPLHAAWRQINGSKRTFLDDYIVSYIPSGYVLNVSQRRLTGKSRQNNTLLTVINPTDDLPYALLENEFVVTLFDPTKQQILEGRQASREAIVQAVVGRNYLHFACHGVYDWQDVRQSRLILPGQNLTLTEIISNLDLNTARLVTLSACETGLTESQMTPDEYIGLPAGLLQAGAPVVIASLWSVADLSTAFLIGRFYQNHIQAGMNIAEALRQAQLWLRNARQDEILPVLQAYVHQLASSGVKAEAQKIRREMAIIKKMGDHPFALPHYWAAFQVVGDAFENKLELKR